ncbi:hypothetical protein MTO96_044099 [Rhipicephalus appendiculatus]
MELDVARMFERKECSFFVASLNLLLTDPNWFREVERWYQDHRGRLRDSSSLAATESLIKISPDDYCLNARNLTAQLLHDMRSALPYYMSSTAATQLPRDAAEFLDNILRTIHTAVMVTQPLPLRFRSFVTLQSQLSPEAKMTKAADTEWDQVTHNSDSVIRRIVGAIACTCIQCLVCRHTTTTADSKIILKLAPPAQRSGDTSVVPLRRLFEEQFFRHATYNYNYDLTVRCAKGCAGELDVHRTVYYNQLYLIFKIERYALLFGPKNMTRVDAHSEIWIGNEEYRLIALICTDGLTISAGACTTLQRELWLGETWRSINGLTVAHGLHTANVFTDNNVLLHAYVALFRRAN